MSGVAILISDNLDFKLKAVVRDTERHYIILKETIHQDDLTIVNICVPDMGATNYMRKKVSQDKESY